MEKKGKERKGIAWSIDITAVLRRISSCRDKRAIYALFVVIHTHTHTHNHPRRGALLLLSLLLKILFGLGMKR